MKPKITTADKEREIALAREGVRLADINYKATWRKYPDRKGWPRVDKALAKLHKAERALAKALVPA